MATQNSLKEGLLFQSHEEADKFIKKWSAEQMSPIVIRSSYMGDVKKNGRISYVCPHGVERKTKCKGDRPRQHVMFTNCPFMINVNQDRKNNTWSITKVVNKHLGHMIGPEVYGGYQNVRKMTEDDVQFVNELDAVGASRRRIAERQIATLLLRSRPY